MSSVISTGTSVTPRNDAKNIANVFVKASGRKSRPSCAVSEKTGTKLTVITSSAKNNARPTPLAPAMITWARSTLFGSRPCVSRKNSSPLCAFSIITIAESTMAPMAMAIPPNDMMLLVTCIHHIGMNDRIMAIGSVMIATTAEVNVPDILQVNRRAVLYFEDDVFDVLDLFDVAATANVVLGRCDLENFAANVGIAHLNRINDVAQRNVVSDERVWIEIDLVL